MINSSPNSPSLNDILKPILEAKGWETDYNSSNCWVKGEIPNKRWLIINEAVVEINRPRSKDDAPNPSDPQFFEKLELWLSE